MVVALTALVKRWLVMMVMVVVAVVVKGVDIRCGDADKVNRGTVTHLLYWIM